MADDQDCFFEEAFTPSVRELLVSALRRAYQSRRELYVADAGDNEETFGFGLYHYSVHEIARFARDSED